MWGGIGTIVGTHWPLSSRAWVILESRVVIVGNFWWRGLVEEGTGWSAWSGAQPDGQCVCLY